MLSKIEQFLYSLTKSQWFYGIVGLSAILTVFGFYIDQPFIGILPFGVFFILFTLYDFKPIYFLLLAFVPLSYEMEFSSSLSMNFPTELLMAGLMIVYFIIVIRQPKKIDGNFFKHPVIILLIAHYAWMIFTTMTSSLTFVSAKYMLAKTWFIIPFVFMTPLVVNSPKRFRIAFWTVLSTFLIAIISILGQQYLDGFSFEEVNFVMHPFFRNKVNYACLLALIFPYILVAITWYDFKDWKKWLLIACIPLFLIATYYSYTRAAYGAIVLACGTFFVIKYKMMKPAIAVALIVVTMGTMWMVHNNNYLKFKPEYEKAVSHESFEDLIEATYKLQDVSSMERVYRWVAGFRMTAEKPWVGWGPNNFYNFYKNYTVNQFKTYISENEERSTVHNQFLTYAVEQGIPGLLIFIIMSVAFFVYGEQAYHRCRNKAIQKVILASILSQVSIYVMLTLNDMIEADKVGTIFFFNIALLVTMDLLSRKELRNQ